MTNEEFYKLHCELEGVYLKLNYLQDRYRKETGRSFIFGQSYKPRPAQPEDSADEHPAVSNGKSAKEIMKGFRDYRRAHHG